MNSNLHRIFSRPSLSIMIHLTSAILIRRLSQSCRQLIRSQNARYALTFDRGLQEMHNQLVELGSVDGSLRDQRFSKEPKVNATPAKSREASNSRREYEVYLPV